LESINQSVKFLFIDYSFDKNAEGLKEREYKHKKDVLKLLLLTALVTRLNSAHCLNLCSFNPKAQPDGGDIWHCKEPYS